MMNYEVKGGLFSAELLEDLAAREGQKADDFGLQAGIRISDEASRTLSMARNQWLNFQQAIERLHPEQTGVSETRSLWIIPLLRFLGFELQFVRSETVDGATFQISHREAKKGGFPVHIAGFRQSLDANPNSSRGNRDSAHVQMQEYLNHTEHLYGIITNGYKLRLLRDHHRLTGIQYLEWDLEQLITENDLASFTMLYRMLHVSRVPQRQGEDSWLERYHQDSVEEGHRVRDKLKKAVKRSLELLGNGFLTHPDNSFLREGMEDEPKVAIAYGYSLRTLVYRLLFLFVAEDRQLVYRPESEPEQRDLYRSHYSLSRLRTLAEEHLSANSRHSDIWEQLKTTFRLFEEEDTGRVMGIAPLGGELFAPEALGELRMAKINNSYILKALDLLSRFDQESGHRIRINYRRINVEEFGAVYESLLDLNPEIDLKVTDRPFQYIDGDSRKGTGSYYTHPDLVKQLLKTALEPVVRERLKAAEQGLSDPTAIRQKKAEALLGIKVCDPACGSGHFLVAAARALATELAYLRAPRGASIDQFEKPALRDVIERCIYGVDLNPDAAELCRLVLWIEAHEAGKPITYLDHKIRCGNSLVGWLGPHENPQLPNEAFVAVAGDDKAVVAACKERNKRALKGNLKLEFTADSTRQWENTTQGYEALAAQPITSLQDYWRKKAAHRKWKDQPELEQRRRQYNVWTYGFFQSYISLEAPLVTQEDLNKLIYQQELVSEELMQIVEAETEAARFFHWPLEFPDVFKKGGFDVLLGNPPWSRIKLQEKKFFAGRKPEIAHATNAAERKRLIAELDSEDVHFLAFQQAKRLSNGLGRYLRKSGKYQLTSGGDINTYSVFSERVLHLISPLGSVGTIVPTGIATDHTNRNFFAHLIEQNRLASLFDFENRDGLFPEIHRMFKCSLITLVGKKVGIALQPEFGFYLHQVSDLSDPRRVFQLTREDFLRINPNTKTCPVLRTNVDASLVKKIYANHSIFQTIDEEESQWKVLFLLMFNMSNDSSHFVPRTLLSNFNQNSLTKISYSDKDYVRVYEAKLFWLYQHRFNNYQLNLGREEGVTRFDSSTLTDPSNLSEPWYWVEEKRILKKLKESLPSLQITEIPKWFISFRKISASSNERSLIASILPFAGFGDSCPVILSGQSPIKSCCLVACLSSIIADFVTRQKLGGNNLAHFLVKQLPVISPNEFSNQDLQFLVPRILELTYSAWDLKYFADDVWRDADDQIQELITKRWNHNKNLISIPDYLQFSFEPPEWVDRQENEFPYPPFRWDENHRHRVQCELDAFFAFKYGLDIEELKYILDPKLSKLAGETQEERDSFSGETFRVLKEKEIRKHGEYRTARLVLEAWANKPWERPEELPDAIEATPTKTSRRNYARIRTMPPVMARIIQRNESPRFTRFLGRTKMEKLLHLIEAETRCDFGRLPEKHHYGPADLDALDEATAQGKAQEAFVQLQKNPRNPEAGYYYQKLEDFEVLLDQFESEFGEQQADIDRIIDLFAPLDRTETELIATVYAAWNNLLIEGELPINDDIIITTSHEWSDAKKSQFNRKDFEAPLQWLRDHNLVPTGQGKLVV